MYFTIPTVRTMNKGIAPFRVLILISGNSMKLVYQRGL